jgi:hypothetical protein
MKSVWIVEQGENYEGGRIISIHSSKESARRVAISTFEEWDWDDKCQVNPDMWAGGCDWLTITEHEVQD